MTEKLRSYFAGPEWVDVRLPEWFTERAEALVKALGDDHADVQLFKTILAEGKVSEAAAAQADALAGQTQNADVFTLAIDIGSHAFSTLQVISQVVPLEKPKAA